MKVHPDAANGIADGAQCLMESAIGSMLVQLRHDARQRPDVAIVPKGGPLKDGRCANVLLRARTTDLGKGGALCARLRAPRRSRTKPAKN